MLDNQSQPTLGSTQIATTNNWDTVFAVDFDAVNEGIAARAKYPGVFNHPPPPGPHPDAINGNFTEWKLTGGSGHLLEMEMKIGEFTCKRSGEADQTRSNATVKIQLSLFTVTGDEGSGVGGGTPISFNLQPPSGLLANSEEFLITVLDFSWAGSESEAALADDCRLLMAGYFNRSDIKDEFEHTFATVHINSRLGKKDSDFEWIAPTDTSYGVIENDAAGGGSFAVLCMVQGNVAPDHHNVSPAVIGNGRAGFLINKPIFLDNMIRPGLACMFGRAPDDKEFIDDNFTIDSDSITNSKSLTINDFSVKDNPRKGDLVTATIPKRSFSISMEDTRLVINFNGMHHPYYKVLGINDAYAYEAHHYYTLQAQADFDTSTNKFGLKPIEDNGESLASYTASLEKSGLGKAVDVGLLVLDIAAIVGSIFQTYKIVTAANPQLYAALPAGQAPTIFGNQLLGTAVRGLRHFFAQPIVQLLTSTSIAVGGIAYASIKDSWENAREEDPEKIKPDMQVFATSVLASVEWPNDAGLTVDNVSFNGGFHITGTPDFTKEALS